MDQSTESVQTSTSENIKPPTNDGYFTSEKKKAIVDQLKAWPEQIVSFAKDIPNGIRKLPESGSFEKPLVYLLTSGLLTGVFMFIRFIQVDFGFAFSFVFKSILNCLVAGFFGSLITNFVLSVMKKAPGYYRTLYFASFLSFLYPVSALLSMTFGILGLVASLAGLYCFYHFSRIVSEVSKIQALILVVILSTPPVIFGMISLFALRKVSYGF